MGSTVDIRPPQQVLELIPGARAERQNGEVTLWMVRQDEAQKVWQTALNMIAERKIPLRKQTDSMVETDWVEWVSEDEDVTIGSRYVMSMVRTTTVTVSRFHWLVGVKMAKCKPSLPPIKSAITPL